MTDLEELKRLLAESGGELRVLLAEMAHTDDGDVYGACLFGLAAVNALPDLIARVERAEKWNVGTVTPRIDVGWEREFVVAVKRAHNGKVYSFAASYLNAYPLRYEYECPKGEGCPRDGCEDGCPTTGWFRLTGDDGEGRLYQQLELNEGDELLGWRDVPQWPVLTGDTPND